MSEVVLDEIEACLRAKNLAFVPGERRGYSVLEIRGAFHVMPYREAIRYGIKPLHTITPPVRAA